MAEIDTKNKNPYELTLLFTAEEAENDVNQQKSNIINTLEKREANIIYTGDFVRRPLAYPINKKISGYIGTIQLWAEPEAVKQMEGELREANAARIMLTHKSAMPAAGAPKRTRKYTPSSYASRKPLKEKKEKVTLEEIDKKLEELIGE